MRETKLQSDELDIIQANNGLKMYLSGLSTGRSATPRSNLFNLDGKTRQLSPEEVRDEWLRKLATLKDGSSFDREVYQFDSHQLEKWGPQGEILPIKELMDDIVLPTFSIDTRPKVFDTALWKKAKREVVKTLHRSGCRGLAPVPYTRVVDDMRARDTLESNSGWPLFTRRNKPEVIKQSCQEAEDGRWKTYPAIALFRNYNRKTRLVWMFPMSANLVEGSYFQPLQQLLMKSQEPYVKRFLSPWRGFEDVRDIMSDVYSKFSEKYAAASDFSSTDAHFKLSTSLEVFDCLKECFQPRFREGLKDSILYMHTIPLVISTTSELTGTHGVSSGSNWTNFIETIFDMLLSIYFELLPGESYYGLYAIGDDMAWFGWYYDEQFADILASVGKQVGQEIKAEKTTNDRDKVVSLQRLFVRGQFRPDGKIRAVYPTIRALKSLVYPERFHKPQLWSKDMEAVRAFMILENCVDHPLFEEFCKFVASGDPNLAVVAKMSAAKQNQLLRKSKLVPGLNPTYNQEKRDSRLSEFASVKFISTLA